MNEEVERKFEINETVFTAKKGVNNLWDLWNHSVKLGGQYTDVERAKLGAQKYLSTKKDKVRSSGGKKVA